MSNILILHNSLDYNQSGVERVSFLLKKELTNRGYNCYEGCIKTENTNQQDDIFIYNFNDSRKKVLSDFFAYISKYSINIVIIQGLFDPNINHAVFHLKKKCPCKFIFCLHNAPSAYARKLPLSPLERVKIFIWYLFKFQTIIFDYRNHRLKMLIEMFGIADKFILLSNTYFNELYKITRYKDENKTICINNPLTFHNPKVDFTQKKKQVLILGRLEDFQKNISSALRIWTLIENSKFHDWKLVIVGSGVDEKKLQNYAKELNLKSYTFIGETSKPEKYYQESSIFMMTSHIEGWPMTLLEAQQYGCVPIVYNTFAALSEIIENNVNGYIIGKYDEEAFAQKTIELIHNDSTRLEFAQNCIEKCKKYSSKAIGDKWDSLLKDLTTNQHSRRFLIK